MKVISRIAVLSILVLGLIGCNTVREAFPPNDEVLTYDLPFDLTYLRAMEAIDNTAGWQLEETNKEEGVIVVRNLEYDNFSDSDLRTITFQIKRVSRNSTSVSIDPKSQKVIGGDALLKAISDLMKREINSHSPSN